MAETTRTGGRAATEGVIKGGQAIAVGHPRTPEPVGFTWRPLSEVARLESGHTPSRKQADYWGGPLPWIGIRDATGSHGRVIYDTLDTVTQAGIDNSSARMLPAGTVCLSRTASVGYVVEMGRPMATSQDFVNWVCGDQLRSSYLRYLLMLEQSSIRRFAHGTTHQTMYYPEAKALHALLPDRATQDAIAAILTALDDKAAANVALLGSVGRLCDAKLARAISLGSRQATVGEVAAFENRKRVPLSAAQRQSRPGPVPYYGATGPIATVDEPLFDQPLALVGEDGSVMRGDGGPVLQYVWGPSWVNNHAHVLVGSTFSTELLHLVLKSVRVREAVTGAVQPKLSMRSLKAVELRIPDSPLAVDRVIQPLYATTRSVTQENQHLTATRDALLPLLMSGKLRVRDAEKVVSDVV